jgi:hypothetical protein
MKLFLKYAMNREIVITSIKVAVVIGTILALINHYDAILSGTLNSTGIIQILLTYLVPYAVATYGAAKHAQRVELEKLKQFKKRENDL